MAKTKSTKQQAPISEPAKPTEYKDLLLTSIIIDPDQPRKAPIKDSDISDLTASIASLGVIEPIVVRPTKQGKKTLYKIVCGERRYRASVNAGTKTIPAMVKTLSDEEAREYQVVENLQRKDVHPVEEGNAYKIMYDADKTIQEISLRVGKSAPYVAKRLKLADLTPEWQLVALDDTIDITTAVNLSKMATDYQQQLYEVAKKNNFQHIDWTINNAPVELTEAYFDLSDTSLNPAMGSCTLCRYNSGNTPMLFDEDGASPVCNKPSCYHIKTQAHRSSIIAKAQEDTSIILVSHSYKIDQEAIADIKALDLPLLSLNDYEYITDPGARLTKDEYAKKKYYGDPEEDPDDFETEYESYKKSHAQEVVEYKQHLATAKKAYVIDGDTIGKEVLIHIKQEDKEPGTESSGISDQIKLLQEREERKQYLTDVKMYKATCDMKPVEKLKWSQTFTDTDRMILACILYNDLYHRFIGPKFFGVKRVDNGRTQDNPSYKKNPVETYIYETYQLNLDRSNYESLLIKEDVFLCILREYFIHKLFIQDYKEPTFYTNYATLASRSWMQEYTPEDLTALEAEYDAINTNRKLRLESRIKSLQS